MIVDAFSPLEMKYFLFHSPQTNCFAFAQPYFDIYLEVLQKVGFFFITFLLGETL